MKKHSILFLALLAAVSCQKENTQDVAPVFDSNVELRASFDEQPSRIATEDGLTFSLEEGKEQIGVYIQNDGMNALENVLYTAGASDEQGWIAFTTQMPVQVQSTSKFFAYAPYSATTVDVSGSTDDNVSEPAAAGSGWNGKRAINLPDLQEQPAAGVKTDIAKYYSVVAVPATPVARDVLDSYSVNLQFSGVFALVRFGLNNFTEGEIKVSKIVFSAENAALTGYFSVDLTHENPKLSNTEYAPEAVADKTFDKVTVTLAEPATIAAQEMAEVYAVVNACAVTTPKLTVYATDAEGKDIVFEKTLSDKTFSRQQRTAIGVKLENPVAADYAQEVINALKNGGTVKIEKDVDLSEKLQIEIPKGTTVNIEVPAGITVKLSKDGEDKRIINYGNVTFSGKGSIESAYGIIRNYGTLTVESGNFKTTNVTGGTALYNGENGTMTINNANVNAAYYALYNENGTMTINGGTFKSTSNNNNSNGQYPAYCVCICGENAETTINYAVIEGIQGGLAAIDNATLTIHDGIFSTYYPENGETNLNHYALYTANVGTATVNGGKFYSEGSKVCIYTGNNDVEGQENGVIYLKGGYFEDMGHNEFTGETIKAAEGYKWVELAEPLVVTNESNGKTNTYYYQIVEGKDLGYKEVDGGYEIYSVNGLQWFAGQVNGGKDFAGETIVLADNMNLKGIAWTPIGNCSRSQTTGAAFRGTFDGNNKVISNLNCALDADDFGAGLFGLLDGATVKNVTIDSGEISNNVDCAGAICGVMVGESVIENCKNTGAKIVGASAAGGIVGRAYSKSNDTIKGCTNSAQVSGSQKVGGIVAIASNGGTHNIENCQNSGSVSGGKDGVGGIVGHTGGNQPTTVKNCTNTGTVGIATDLYAAGIVGFSIAASCNIENSNNEGTVAAINAGGIFGCVGSTQATNISGCKNLGDVTGVNIAGGISAGASSGTLENCKNTANITASAEGGIAGGIAGQYREATIINCAGGAADAVISAKTAAGRIIGHVSNTPYYPSDAPNARLTIADGNGDDYSGISSIGAMGQYTSFANITIAGGTLHGLPIQSIAISRILIEEGAAWDMYPNETGIWTSDKTHPWGREGLAETDAGYDITNIYGILHFAQMVNNGVSTFSGKTIVLTADADLGGEEWTPIGIGTRDGSTYTGNAFKGTFDGNGKTISGLKISERSNSAGLIGVLDGGTVKNVTLNVDIDVAAKHSELAAGCVGLLTNNGLVENVTVNGSVKSEKAAAGIVSRVLKSGTVRNCHNHATVSGTSYNIGGIVGAAYYNNEGMTIEGCTNDGAVSGNYAVGGIVGFSAANIKNCTNTGAIITETVSAGGIVGEQQNSGSIIGCTNNAKISNNSDGYGTGGIVGWIRYIGGASVYSKEVITVSENINYASIDGGNDAGGIVGTVYQYGMISNNKNYAQTLTAKTFVGGIVGNVQFIRTDGSNTSHDGMPDTFHVDITNNYSETTLDNMTGVCKGKFAYTNDSALTTISGNTPDDGVQVSTAEEAIAAIEGVGESYGRRSNR